MGPLQHLYLHWGLLAAIFTLADGQAVYYIQPQVGSTNGATRITITGQGFADANQFNYGSDSQQLGNSVQLVSTTRSIPCDVEKDASHGGTITCFTRAMPEDNYIVRVSVNGDPISDDNMCGGNFQSFSCSFYPRTYNTPTITSIQTLSGAPGAMITINGRIFTDVFGSNTALSSNGRNVRILRTYVGGMPCELLKPNSDTLYGLQVNSWDMGFIVCRTTGTYVGHLNVSFILDADFGRSAPDLTTYAVSSLNQISMYQTYAVVNAISPEAGSIYGGTLLTISGQYFDDTDLPISVFVGGQKCDVQDHTATTIRCRAPPRPLADQLHFTTVFPGGRGLMLEVWTNKSPTTNLEDALAYDHSTTGYAGASWVDSASYAWPDALDTFIARLSGFIVVPELDNYTFFIRGDDRYALYFSHTGLPEDKVKVAYGTSPTSSFYSYFTQRSDVFLLEVGKEYYIEIYLQEFYSVSFVDVALFKERSSYTAQQITDAVNEVQVIQSTSSVMPEKQVITLENWATSEAISEVQLITVTCEDMCSSFYYTLIYNMERTGLLSAEATGLEVESALNALWSIKPDTVDVTANDSSQPRIYTVTFNSQRGEFDLLSYEIAEGMNITVNIIEQTKGVPGMDNYTLVCDGVYSQAISAQASTEELKAAVVGMASSICPDSIAKYTEGSEVKYFRDYETGTEGYSGERTSEIEAFCGRYALKNPWTLFYTNDVAPSGLAYGDIALAATNQFCFAYRGLRAQQIGLTFQYQDSRSLNTEIMSFWFDFNFAQEDSWSYTCMNLLELIKTRYVGRYYFLKTIYLPYASNTAQPMYVDAVYVGQRATTDSLVGPLVRRPAVLANKGIFFHDLQVEETSAPSPPANKQYTLTMTTYNCGFNIPLMGVAFAQASSNGTRDTAEYRGSTWPNNSMITVRRLQAATPPIGGTFDIRAYGRTIRGLRVDISGAELQYALQSLPEMGQVLVQEQYGSCTGYSRRIEWLTATGAQPLLQVDDSNITGVSASVRAQEVTKGGLFRHKILGDMLRTPETQPQVTVYINGLPSQCNGSCAYTWDQLKTPVISALDPNEENVSLTSVGAGNQNYTGPFAEGRNLTISGSGFAASTAGDTTAVFIGAVSCPVITVSENEIVCKILRGSAGIFPVMVYIAERGFALSASDKFFNFTYKMHVTDISPSSGGTAGRLSVDLGDLNEIVGYGEGVKFQGGTILTVEGSGFNENSRVLIGDRICSIITANLTEIKCMIPPKNSMAATVVISTSGFTVTLTDCFEYTSGLNPVIEDFNPVTCSVLGGTNLTLAGSNFGSASDEVTVRIGQHPCPVLEWSTTQVICLLPSLPPGDYPIQMQVGNMGLASISPTNDHITYILEVTSISPQCGSLYGGSKITLAGSGFSRNIGNNVVQIGGISCQVTFSTENTLVCVIQSTGATYTINNNGRDYRYGVGYTWLPSSLDIAVGDTVIWRWEAPAFIHDIGYTVFSVSAADGTTYDGKSFTNGNRLTNSGSFMYTFTSPGVYYYSSGKVGAAQIAMQGAINVLPVPDREAELHLLIGGQEALYIPGPVVVQRRRSKADCIALEPDCTQASNRSANDRVFLFEFSKCYSPSITGITPSNGTILDPITITGTGFSNITCANEVTVGSYPCVITSSSEYTLTCSVDPQDSMGVGIAELVSLTVHNLGSAINTLTNEFDRRFVLLPHIELVTPNLGSLTGKTRLAIHGSGFAGLQSNMVVTIAGYPCVIVSVSYTEIVCDTPPSSAEQAVYVDVVVAGIRAQCRGNCGFSYSDTVESSISSVFPTTLDNTPTEIVIEGEGFDTNEEDIVVYVGASTFQPTSATYDNVTCIVTPLPAGDYTLTVVVLSKGLATGSLFLHSPAEATLSPTSGSIMGGTTLSFTGNGFDPVSTTVNIGANLCEVISITPAEMQCVTAANSAGAATVQIVANSVAYPPLTFTYALSETPQVTSVLPDKGPAGTEIILRGTGLGSSVDMVTVTIGNVACAVVSVSDTELHCTVGSHAGGTFPVIFLNFQKGYAQSMISFMYEFSIQRVSPVAGSYGGGQTLTVSGNGFDENTSRVFICDTECIVNQNASDSSNLVCETPPNNGSGASHLCNVRVENGVDKVTLENAYTYQSSLTPTISDVTPRRGGTGGGVSLTITGTGFSTNLAEIDVSIAGATCEVLSANSTQIVCRTHAQSPSQRTKVKVNIGGNGIANLDNADFFYIDVWSSPYTWGGESPPDTGFLAVISPGQTILLDQSTPVLKMLLIQGGTLVFDEADIELQAENILITNGGVLQIGTEAVPFQHKAIITLHGHLRSPELPVYGAKTLAVRQGTLDLHGLPVPVTWTRLAGTSEAGSVTLNLQEAVTWNVGDQIVIATTGHRLTQSQNEKRNITSVSEDGKTLTIAEPLTYQHLGISVTLPDGTVFEARAEVGLLTRNILIRGSDNPEWDDTIPACPAGFAPGEFAVQTCFQGRFGEEIGSDQFGGCVMFHAPMPEAQLAIGRIEYVELFHVGQAFRLGRYPIHFHLLGDLQFKSYVRGCSIHQAYNRAVAIHNTHHLLVEKTVIYDIMGGAFFIEDGIEHGNVLQYNLAIFVRQSTSLLNDDITPAAFWVTNPNNTIRHNAVAGGTHFGFWYRMHDNPDGPSFNPNICQKRVPLGEFYNNTVHSQGWFGIWIFQEYFPMQGGACYSTTPQPAVFDSLTTWNCQKGAEWVNGGALQFKNFMMVNNENAGIEMKRIVSGFVGGWGETNGAVIKNSTIVGHVDELGTTYCTFKGIILPFDEGLTIFSTKFMNFDRSCAAIGVTSIVGVCTDRCGGWSAKFAGIQFFNTSNKAGFRWEHEVVLIDVDGSLTGFAGRKVVPKSGLLDPSECSHSAEWSFIFDGFVCNSSVSFHRLGFNNPSPSSFLGQDAIFSNEFGVSVVPFLPMRLTHKPGWMALLPNAHSYNWYFHDVAYITNMSYQSTFYGFKAQDYVIISHNLTQRPDMFSVIDTRNGSAQPLNSSTNVNGDWHFDDNTTTLTYLVSGTSRRARRAVTGRLDPAMSNINVNLGVYQCFYQGCIPPPPPTTVPMNGQRPAVYDVWSNSSFWLNHNQSVPTDGADVVIPSGTWVVADVDLPIMRNLTVYGVLELKSLLASRPARAVNSTVYRKVVLSAIYISVQGGRLIAGYEDAPFQGELDIILRGNHTTPEHPLPGGPNQGSKVLGVFGGLDLHGTPRSVYKTKMSQTAPAGSTDISLVDVVDWTVGALMPTGLLALYKYKNTKKRPSLGFFGIYMVGIQFIIALSKVGEDIVITTTSYDSWQTETRSIVSVSPDGKTLTLNESLSFGHIAETHQVPGMDVNYTIAADVGILSRNIKIIGEDYPGWYAESFGARVLIGTFNFKGVTYRGNARISNVEFYHSGQEGYRDDFDPRYSLAFLDLGETNSNETYVQGCAFHNGFSPAIGVFGTNGLDIDDNIIHFTVGEGIRIWGERNRAQGNLVTLAIWPSTYQGRNEVNNLLLWHAGIEVNNGIDIVLQNNVVAGFERVGYRINGEPCPGVTNPAEKWFHNEAHGGLYGVYMQKDGLPGCSLIQGFSLWKCWDYGIYFQPSLSILDLDLTNGDSVADNETTMSIQIANVLLVDNGMGILSIIYTPPSVTHETSNKTVSIQNSYFVGSSPNFNCYDVLTNSDANIKLSAAHRSARPPNGGRSGICWPYFSSGHNDAPVHPQAGLMSYNAISGLMTVKVKKLLRALIDHQRGGHVTMAVLLHDLVGIDSLFVGYKNVCSVETNVMFMTNPENEDLQHPVHVSGIQMADTEIYAKVFLHQPDLGKVNPSDCVDMTCDAKRKALLKDLDGSFLGSPGSVVPFAEYQWNGDRQYGLGDYRIPKVMLTYLNGSRIPVNQIAPNKGIIRDSTCSYMPSWESYKCTGLDYEMLVIESLDPDTETRRLSPVAVLSDGYVDLINGPQDHGWCNGYTCQKRVSLFHSIVASNKSFEVYFTSISPQNLRLMLLNADNTKAVRVAIYFAAPQRLDVFVENNFIAPSNAQWNTGKTDFTLKPPTYTGQYVPQFNSTTPGENYFDSTYQMLYIMLRGSTPVEIHTSPLLVIAFNLPAMSVAEFYDGGNLVRNLALFLKIPSDKIRVTKIIAADGTRIKRATTGLTVSVEIANPPTLQLTNSTNTTGQLDFASLVNISQSIAAASVAGTLTSALNTTVASAAVSNPSPSPGSAEWQQMATANVSRTQPTASFVATVSTLKVIVQPVAGLPGELLSQQPVIQAVDVNDNCVDVGASALTLTAQLKNSAAQDVPGGLLGKTTIAFSNCWANFTDLLLVPSGSGFTILFSLNTVNAQSRSFDPKSSVTGTTAAATTMTTTTTTTLNSGPALRSGLVFQSVLVIMGILLSSKLNGWG